MKIYNVRVQCYIEIQTCAETDEKAIQQACQVVEDVWPEMEPLESASSIVNIEAMDE